MTLAPTSPAKLKQSMLFLRNAAPEEFVNFLKELESYVMEITVAVTDAPASDVLLLQGRAQQARALLRSLAECHLQPKPRPPTP